MRLLTIISAFILLSFNSYSQKYCTKTSVYFDLNKSELTSQSINSLDSLSKALKGKELAIELYAFTDSSASNQYNLELSQKRNAAVRSYLELKKNLETNYKFTEKHFGESQNGTNANDDAYYRRVDIFLVPMRNGKLLFSEGNEEMELPADYFEPCGICATKPKLKGLYTAEEAREENVEFTSNEGISLVTAGTVKLDFDPCGTKKKSKTACLTFFIKSAKYDPEMTIWSADTINGIIYWRNTGEKPSWDSVQSRYYFCGADPIHNLDKNLVVYSADIIFPKEFSTIKSKITMLYEKPLLSQFDSVSVNNIGINKKTATKSIGKINNTSYYFSGNIYQYVEDIDSTANNEIRYHFKCRVPLSAFTQMTFSDTTIKFMYKKKAKVENIGIYVIPVTDFFPFLETLPKNQLRTAKPLSENQVAIIRKDKIYVADLRTLKVKYKKRKNLEKIKLNNENLNKFTYYGELVK